MILEQFDKTTSELVRLVSSLTESELNHSPNKNSWSIAQVAQHLSRSYQIIDVLNGRTKPCERPIDEKLKEIEKTFFDFSIKMKSPDEIIPDNEFLPKEGLIRELKRRIEAQRHFIIHQDLSPICMDFEIPVYGAFTRHEWIGFNIIHTKRHINQIKTIIDYLVSTT